MIKDILDKLPDRDRRRLLYALEQQLSQHVVLPDKTFIGVNVRQIPNLQIQESAGVWSCGKVK